MTNYSNNIFKYNNKNFSFFASLYTGNNEDSDVRASLDCADIQEFVYESKLNSLVLTGHIIYTDKYAYVDKFISQHLAYCKILFAENIRKNDNGVVIEKLDESQQFQHTFIITNIRILSRNQSIIKYQIDLVSNNWFNCIANVKFSNYGQSKQQVFDILKACLKYNDLTIDDEKYDIVKSQVSLNYITSENDNLFSIAKYLVHKMYYFPAKDTELKFFLYNESTDKYQLFDATNKQSTTGIYNTILSMFKTNNEGLIQEEPTNIVCFEQDFQKTSVFRSLFDYQMHDFSYDTNKFSIDDVKTDTTVNYINEKIDVDNYEKKFYKLFDTSLIYKNYGTFWNNDQDTYGNLLQSLFLNNAIVLNITGEILRKPGSMLVVALDRSMKNVSSEDKKELEKIKRQYKAFEGTWFVSKVQHIIQPSMQRYRQQVCLFRNFIPALTPSA